MTRFAVTAPAKINLHLQVLGRRPDGYHELRTLYQSIDLADELRAEAAPDGELRLEVEPRGAAPGSEDNLVMRAVKALRDHAGVRAGAHIELVKRIPVAAGLGGGSADAAAGLVLLNALWQLDLGLGDLTDLAAGIGSDVPFFLHGGFALGFGRGEEVCPLLDLERHAVVVVVPAVELSTESVFSTLPPQLTWEGQEATVDAFAAGWTRQPRWQDLRNDLEPEVAGRWPEVRAALAVLRAGRPLHAAMSGSGAAVFAVFPDLGMARRSVAGLDKSWWVHFGSFLERERARLVVRTTDDREGYGI
ncbi:MAG: 4-(cytidine 5'-diphospho)-2-C-methyl-D-erythritol kinase [Thermoanaerobaculales bacterium]